MEDKPYDLSTILAMCDNNRPFLEKLLVIFTETLSTELSIIKQAANDNDWVQVGKTAHKIKPSLSHFNINSIKDDILALEHHESHDPATLKPLVDHVELVINDVLVQLKAEYPDVFSS